MAVTGIFTSDAGIRGEVAPSFAGTLVRTTEVGGTAPLFALSSGMPSEPISTWYVMWIDATHNTGRAKVTVAATASAASVNITLDDASYVVPGQWYLVETTDERLYVLSVNGKVITVTRGFQGSTIAAIGANTYIQRIGTAFAEGSDAPDSVMEAGVFNNNLTSIFRNSWGITGTADAVQYATGSKKANNREQCAQFHAEDIEASMWYSNRYMAIQSGKRLSTMGGINYYMKQTGSGSVFANFADGTGTSADDIDTFIANVFQQQIRGLQNERICFAGNGAVQVIQKIVRENTTMQIVPGASLYGMAIQYWETPFGKVTFLTHPMFNRNPVFTKNLYLLHPGAITTSYLRPTQDLTDAYVGQDSKSGGLITEMTMQVRCLSAFGAMININKAA